MPRLGKVYETHDIPEGLQTFVLTTRTILVHAPVTWHDAQGQKFSDDIDKYLNGKLEEMKREIQRRYNETWVTFAR